VIFVKIGRIDFYVLKKIS